MGESAKLLNPGKKVIMPDMTADCPMAHMVTKEVVDEARKKYDDKCKTDPVWLAYNRAYKAHYARYMKKKMTVPEFEEWSRQAIQWRTQAEEGKLALDVYQRMLKK